jgi:hypothetical protein
MGAEYYALYCLYMGGRYLCGPIIKRHVKKDILDIVYFFFPTKPPFIIFSMVQKIKAIGLKEPGSASVLNAMEIEDPPLNSNDIKVRIKAVSVNPSM